MVEGRAVWGRDEYEPNDDYAVEDAEDGSEDNADESQASVDYEDACGLYAEWLRPHAIEFDDDVEDEQEAWKALMDNEDVDDLYAEGLEPGAITFEDADSEY